jgi:hypothetical protein
MGVRADRRRTGREIERQRPPSLRKHRAGLRSSKVSRTETAAPRWIGRIVHCLRLARGPAKGDPEQRLPMVPVAASDAWHLPDNRPASRSRAQGQAKSKRKNAHSVCSSAEDRDPNRRRRFAPPGSPRRRAPARNYVHPANLSINPIQRARPRHFDSRKRPTVFDRPLAQPARPGTP